MKLIKLIGLETCISKNITIKFSRAFSSTSWSAFNIFLQEKKEKNQGLHVDLYRRSNIDTGENDREKRYTYFSRFFDL